MANIITRETGPTAKGSPLTNTEVDNNFINLNAELATKLPLSGGTLTGSTVISVNDNTNSALRITQVGTGNALLVEDEANPDSSPFVINAAGNVGVGTTTPSAKLSLQQTGLSANTNMFNSVTEHTNSSVAFYDLDLYSPTVAGGGSTMLRFRKAGGTLASPAIVNTNSISGRLGSQIHDGAAFYDNALFVFSADGTPALNSTPGKIQIYTTPAGSAGGLAERMRITSAGNVGIGTSAPGQRLTVFSGTASSAIAEFTGVNPNRGLKISTALIASTNDSGVILDAQEATNGTMILATRSTERMRIDSAGNVGIGTSAPTAKLDISGNSLHLTETSANLDTFKVLVDSGGAGYSHTYLKGQAYTLATYTNPQASNYTVNSNVYSAQSSGVISSLALVLGAGAAERMRITSAGDVGIGTTTPASKLGVAGTLTVSNGGSISIPSTSIITAFDESPIDSTGHVFTQKIYPTISYAGTDFVSGDSIISSEISATLKPSVSLPSGTLFAYGLSAVISTDVNSVGTFSNHDIRAVYGNVYHYSNSNLPRMVGVAGRTYNRGTGTVTDAYSFWARNNTNTGGGGLTSSHGLYIDNITSAVNNYGITSLVSAGANKWNIYASGTANNHFAGSLGIGTTSIPTSVSIGGATGTSLGISINPQGWNNALHRLTVPTNGDTSVWSFNYSGSAVDYSGYATSSISVGNGAILFSTNTTNTAPTERMRLDATGTLGVGVVPSAWGTGFKVAQVGTSSVVGNAINGASFNSNWYFDNATARYIDTGTATRYLQTNGTHRWFNAPSGTAGTAVTLTETVRIDTSGNFGIGISSPTYKLDVIGSVGATARLGKALITDDSPFVTGANINSGTSALAIGMTGSNQIHFFTTNLERMRVTSAGDVGIGTTTPGVKLDVVGADNSGLQYRTSTRSIGVGQISGVASLYAGSGTELAFHIGSEHMRLTSAGNLGIGTTSPGSKLDVVGTTMAFRNGNLGTAGSLDVGLAVASPVSARISFGTDNTGWQMRFAKNVSGTYTDYVTITDGGNVGIGTVTPGVKLDINGSARIANASSLLWFNHNSTANGPSITGSSDTLQVSSGPNGPGRGALLLLGHNNTTLQTDAGFLELKATQTGSAEAYISLSTGGSNERMRITSTGNVGIGTSTPGYKLEVNGSFAATSKSFLIPHPTKSGKKLRHGSLEGPEHGVYVRGKTQTNVIELPEYWTKLVDPDSITVQLTPIGKHQKLYVEKIEGNKVYIANDNMLSSAINCFYYIQAERVDVDKLEVEID